MDTITVVASSDVDCRFCKTVYRERGELITGRIRLPKEVEYRTFPFTDLASFWRLLYSVFNANVEAPGRYAIIRGQPRDDAPSPAPRSGATFAPAPRRWVALDVDRGHASWTPSDARQALPAPFRDAACVWHASASRGVKPGARFQLWFLLTDYVSDTALTHYFRDVDVVDTALFQTVQPHFLSPPINADLVSVDRIGVLQGTHYVDANCIRLDIQPYTGGAVFDPLEIGRAVRYYRGAYNNILRDVANAAEGERQYTLVRAMVRIVGLSKAIGINPNSELDAIATVAKANRPDDHDEIDRALAWALEHTEASTQWQ